MNLLRICNRIIEYSFYSLFLLVPLAFTSATSELFELNKMWLTWGLTIIIGAAWFIKMVLQRRISIQKTPLDIPIILFLVSQIISTIFSLDSHVSLWGYYSRFNGGLLSIISYILLYYAFISNFSVISSRFSVFGFRSIGLPDHQTEKLKTDNLDAVIMVKRLLTISLISGLIVALWGLPSHFGYDPTCLLFRGTFDVSCWTADFLPKIRIFSTLGQPDWLAAYLAILIPISIAIALNNLRSQNKPQEKLQISNSKLQKYNSNFKFPMYIFYFLFTILFYIDLLYTRARSGFIALWISLIFFFFVYIWTKRKERNFSSLVSHFSFLFGVLLFITFIIGAPIAQLNRFTLEGISNQIKNIQAPKNQTQSVKSGGTESANIRLNVWTGAVNIWKANPLFGTGVETFAFAYYKYKPASQNLTSEWNFLYNKAHNEYLNFLATTGAFGLTTYLFMIGWFLFLTIKQIPNSKFLISNQAPNSKSQLGQLEIRSIRNLVIALLASYISILITNFFGFSVVMTNVYLFMIPAFVFVLSNMIKNESKDQRPKTKDQNPDASVWQWTPIFFILVISCFLLIILFRFWQADIAFALGYNLDRAGEYQQAYPNLHQAVKLRGDEPVFKDELSLNAALLAAGLASQKISVASSLAQEAINTSNEIISQHPNNAVFWKTRVKLFFTLSQVDSRYLTRALAAIEKASLLAPADANIWYNLGVLYGQNNNLEKGISALEKTIILKPDYRDAHYALGLFYHQKAIDKNGNVIDSALQEKAIAQMQYILDHLISNDAGAMDSLKAWKQEQF